MEEFTEAIVIHHKRGKGTLSPVCIAMLSNALSIQLKEILSFGGKFQRRSKSPKLTSNYRIILYIMS
jgi:hypothetical protein